MRDKFTAGLVAGFLAGIAFAYFLGLVSERHYLLKGAVWGLVIAWMIWTVTFLFRMRPEASSPENAVANDLSAAVYGVTLAWLYRRLYTPPRVDVA